jgi:hypothetical protein
MFTQRNREILAGDEASWGYFDILALNHCHLGLLTVTGVKI